MNFLLKGRLVEISLHRTPVPTHNAIQHWGVLGADKSNLHASWCQHLIVVLCYWV